jgi:hypothetical protein
MLAVRAEVVVAVEAVAGFVKIGPAYDALMRDDESLLELRRTQLLAVDASLVDARRSLLRAARIPSTFSAEVRALLTVLVALDRRVMLEVER